MYTVSYYTVPKFRTERLNLVHRSELKNYKYFCIEIYHVLFYYINKAQGFCL